MTASVAKVRVYRASAGSMPVDTRDEAQIAGEISQVAAGTVRGHRFPDQNTVRKRLGNVARDVASAAVTYDHAAQNALGAEIEF